MKNFLPSLRPLLFVALLTCMFSCKDQKTSDGADIEAPLDNMERNHNTVDKDTSNTASDSTNSNGTQTDPAAN